MGTIYLARLLRGERSVRILHETTIDMTRFTLEVGWLLVSKADADYLCDVRSDPEDAGSALAFDVCQMDLPDGAAGEEDSDLRYFAQLNAVAMNEFGGCPLPGHMGWATGAWVPITRSEGHLLACLPSRLRDPVSAPAFDVRAERTYELVDPLRDLRWPLAQALPRADAPEAMPVAEHNALPQAPGAKPSANGHSERLCARPAVTRARPMNLVLGVSVRDSPTTCR